MGIKLDEEEPFAYVVNAYDPGGVTGWSLFAVHPIAMEDPGYRVMDNIMWWTAGEFVGPENEQVDQMVRLAASWPSARLVMEDFILQQMNMSRDLLSPVRIASKFEYAVRPRPVITQMPALAKTTITDARLKAMGFWLPGPEHKRDATKHALTRLKIAKDRRIKELAHLASQGQR
jgi:hypothetical protein